MIVYDFVIETTIKIINNFYFDGFQQEGLIQILLRYIDVSGTQNCTDQP